MAAPNLANLVSQVQAKIKEEEKEEAEEARRRLTEADIHTAWGVLCPGGHDNMSKPQLLDALKPFYPDIKPADIKELVGHGLLTPDKLIDLLVKKPQEHPFNFDPVEEAFYILDPHHTGAINPGVLKHIVHQMKDVLQMDEEDVALMMRLADVDQDGKISLQDFKQIGRWALKEENHRPVVVKRQ